MKTKIVATIGPASDQPAILESLAHAGMNIARMNFSHCTYSEYQERRKTLNRISKKIGRKIAVMQDLQGPRIRVGTLPEDGLKLDEGVTYSFSFHTTKPKQKYSVIPISDPYLHADITPGDPLYLANGDLELQVTKVKDGIITATTIRGGILFSNKGINVPRTKLRRGGLTPKDIKDAKFGAQHGVDFIALSFVQDAKDIHKLRRILGEKSAVKIIAKIERAKALENIDEIIQAADGIMVARGDLGIEIPVEDLPIVQKNLIRHAHWHNKPAILATQIMTSMIKHHHPTRAEVSDIANGVLDGADALMLSDETAAGDFPVHAVTEMRKIIIRIEKYLQSESMLPIE